MRAKKELEFAQNDLEAITETLPAGDAQRFDELEREAQAARYDTSNREAANTANNIYRVKTDTCESG